MSYNYNEKPIVGTIDEILVDVASTRGIKIDREKFEFLKAISKTKYSGLTKKNLMESLNVAKDKSDDWFAELVEDGLAETFSFNSPNKAKKWEGWFITPKGRKLVREIMAKM